MVEIKGLEKFSSKDFPGHISSTVFLGGCTFRCPFCHNADLVLRPESFPTMPMDLFLGYLDGRKGWLEGVCITGGEPLLSEDVEDLMRVIKERGLLVKLDTNGSLPGRLEKLVGDGVVDWIAMDVKAPIERYSEVAGTAVREEDIRRSVEIVKAIRAEVPVPDDRRAGTAGARGHPENWRVAGRGGPLPAPAVRRPRHDRPGVPRGQAVSAGGVRHARGDRQALFQGSAGRRG